MFRNAWVFDVETYPNFFSLVARPLDSKGVPSDYVKFVIHEDRDDRDQLLEWLQTRPTLIGFNNIAFDAQVVEEIYRNPKEVTPESIYELAMHCIDVAIFGKFNTPYSEWDFSFNHIDLFKLNHYNSGARSCSLKWLEFTLRYPKMVDLPVKEGTPISKSRINTVLSYNTNDVNVTYDFYYKCIPALELRKELYEKFKDKKIMSMSDSSLATFIFKRLLSKKMGIDEKELSKLRTYRKEINIKDHLVDYICFEDPELRSIHEYYKGLVVDGVKGLKGTHKQKIDFKGMELVYGTGGLHGCRAPGVYRTNESEIIMSIDVTSYYPWLAMANNLSPEHLGESFLEVYRNVYKQRQEHAKGTALNYALKIVLNSAYGKSNSVYSFLYDPAYTLAITINGQLLLTMLLEALSTVGNVLIANTDGLEIKLPKENLPKLKGICSQWEILTGLRLEQDEYKLMVIRDVNNYLAVYKDSDKYKRKGFFEIYDDIIGAGGSPIAYHKNPSGEIIPRAIFNYYVHDKPVEETINECNDIYPFLYAMKRRKNFEYWFLESDEMGHISIDKRDERVIRYYVANKGASLYKFMDDNKIKHNGDTYDTISMLQKCLEEEDVNEIRTMIKLVIDATAGYRLAGQHKGQLLRLAMTIKDSEIEGVVKSGKYKGEPLTDFADLNKDHYIYEAYKVIEEIESQEKTNEFKKQLYKED